MLTQFGAGNVEGLAEAALHDVPLVVEEGGEAVHQAGHQQGGQAGQAEEQVAGGADVLHRHSGISMFSHHGEMQTDDINDNMISQGTRDLVKSEGPGPIICDAWRDET